MINSIQVLRGISILLVVFYHTSAVTDDVRSQYYFQFGRIGVDIFFIISGYIMALICEREEPIATFIKKRIIRVFPLYICVTLLAALLNYKGELISGSEQVWASLIKSILMVPHYSIANQSKIFPIFIPGWTITYEMWFYALIALTGILFKFKEKILLVPYLLSIIYVSSSFLPEGPVVGFLGNSVYLTFSIGMLVRFHEIRKITLKTLLLSVVYLFALALIIEKGEARLIVLGVPAFIIFIVFFLWVGDRLNPLAFVGKISYSLYLTHVFSINIVELVLRKVNINIPFGMELMMFMAVVMSVLVASLSHSLFEKRLDAFLRNIIVNK